MIDALLRAFGLRTGRFTSPHLQSVRERIALDGAADRPGAVRRDLRRHRSLPGAGRLAGTTSGCRSSRCSRRWRTPPSPTRRSTSPSSRSAWAAPGTRPTSPTRRSPWSRRSPSTTALPRLDASSRSPARRPGSSSRAATACSPQQPVEAAEVLLRRSVEVGRDRRARGAGVRRPGADRSPSAGRCVGCAGWAASTTRSSCRCIGAHQAHNAAVRAGRGRGVPRRRARGARAARRRHRARRRSPR